MIYILKDKKYKLSKGLLKPSESLANSPTIKKLSKKVEKWYYNHNQRLKVTSIELRNEKSTSLDIFVCNDKGEIEFFLFTFISDNYKYSDDLYFGRHIKFVDDLSGKPYYINREFYLRKPYISDDAIWSCVKYYTNKVLDCWIWNIEVM